ncbi:hypothetical protein [Chryseobacterium sp. ERMR1:04]|uniref:immunity protein Imm33 domain-containing protein n=1 Tax=Chryseobacterium sp. ERMR1:04 TaxID=1705393 RepID=UPI0006C83B0E|nr:hypothetical protein [Chryseobacterium sp. ERMR1:04]
MIQHKKIVIKVIDNYIYTEGLIAYINKEVRLIKGDFQEIDYIDVIKYIIDYVVDNQPVISENQKIGYYSWALQFKIVDSNFFDLYEANINGEDIKEGCEFAISLTKDQSEICAEYGLIPLFPNFSQMIVISKGVYEGKDIEAIRYDSPEHMSGWWLITDDYDDDIKSLMTVHFYHVAFKRPDILKYLALPFGYRFLMENNEIEVTKDEDE